MARKTKRCGCEPTGLQPHLDNSIVVGMTIGGLREGKQEVFGYGRMSRDDRRVPDGDTIYEFCFRTVSNKRPNE